MNDGALGFIEDGRLNNNNKMSSLLCTFYLQTSCSVCRPKIINEDMTRWSVSHRIRGLLFKHLQLSWGVYWAWFNMGVISMPLLINMLCSAYKQQLMTTVKEMSINQISVYRAPVTRTIQYVICLLSQLPERNYTVYAEYASRVRWKRSSRNRRPTHNFCTYFTYREHPFPSWRRNFILRPVRCEIARSVLERKL